MVIEILDLKPAWFYTNTDFFSPLAVHIKVTPINWYHQLVSSIYNIRVTTKLIILDLLNSNYLPSFGFSQYLIYVDC